MKTVDQYILELEKWQDEVQLLREIILDSGLSECIKWGAPSYMWENKNVVGVAAFKSYVGLWFFQGGLLKDEGKLLVNVQDGKTKAMRQWRFTSIDQIADSPLTEYLMESIEYFKQGVTIKAEPKTKTALAMSHHLHEALNADEVLATKWQTISPACKREYAEYINEAKKDETKINRIEKIIPMILQSKGLNDKYKK